MTTSTETFSQTLAESISTAIGEPAWARDLRLQAWRAYEATPMPTRRDEGWRRLNLAGLDLAAFRGGPSGEAALPAGAQALLDTLAERGGLVAQVGGDVAGNDLQAGVGAKGVIYTTLEQALREHGDLVRPHFERHVLAPKSFKFAGLNAALWTGGMFLYVPKGVVADVTLAHGRWLAAGGGAIIPRTLIVLGDGAYVRVLDAAGSFDDAAGLHCGATDIVLGENAELHFTTLQQWGSGVWNFDFTHAWLGRNARLRSVDVALGGRVSRTHLSVVLEGPGAEATMEGVYVGTGSQQFDFRTLQDHVAPHSSSDLLYKGALRDTARAGYEGVVRMEHGASGSAASQANHNLLLNQGATADSVPVLEILATDVERCNHGATVGQIDPDQLYYLLSRGLSEQDARELVVAGFLDPVLGKLPSEALQTHLRTAVGEKLAFSHNMAQELAG